MRTEGASRPGGRHDTAKAREFLDFWVENCIHAAEQYGTPGGSQDVAELARRCVEMAVQQGLTEQDLRDAADDITDYVREADCPK